MKTYKSKARNIKLSVEEGDPSFNKAKINSSEDAANYARQFYFDDITIYESFFIILLNRSNNTIAWVKISQGGTIGTTVDPIIVAKYAIDILAKAVILVHNHPSGNNIPSEGDKLITEKIKQGLSLFEINVLDHVILTEDTYYSFADEGLI